MLCLLSNFSKLKHHKIVKWGFLTSFDDSLWAPFDAVLSKMLHQKTHWTAQAEKISQRGFTLIITDRCFLSGSNEILHLKLEMAWTLTRKVIDQLLNAGHHDNVQAHRKFLRRLCSTLDPHWDQPFVNTCYKIARVTYSTQSWPRTSAKAWQNELANDTLSWP